MADAIDPAPGGQEERTVVSFLLRLREDQAQGVSRRLSDYLSLFPEAEEAIAREYLLVSSFDREQDRAADARQVLGRFHLQRELGQGGQGTVYLAYETLLGRQVALKILRQAPGDDLDEARVLRSATLLARLDHPHVCRIYGAGREGPTLWMATQYIDGRSLREELQARARREEPMPVPMAAALLAAVARGLQHAHEHQVVHRDVKPANILLPRQGGPVLTDFGLATDAAPRHDLTGGLGQRGTAAYMAPEQFHLATAEPGMDVWAAGVVLFECVTLMRPFEGATDAAIMQAVAGREVWSHARWPSLPADLRAVLATALAKEPARRYATAGELAQDLERLAQGRPVSVRAPGTWRRTCHWARRERALAMSLGAALLMLLAGLGTALWLLGRERTLRAAAEEQAARTRAVACSILFDMDDTLESRRGTVATRYRLVLRAKNTLAQLQAAQPDAPQLRRELALAWMRLGDVTGHPAGPSLGDEDAADECFAAAEALARRGLLEDPRGRALLGALLVKRADLARVPALARRRWREALAVTTSADTEQRRVRGNALARLAQDERDLGRFEAALELITAAERERSAPPEDPRQAVDLAAIRGVKATVLASAGDYPEAERLLRSILADLDQLRARDPDELHATALHQSTSLLLAKCCMAQGADREALAGYDAVLAAARTRVSLDPSDRSAVRRLAEVLLDRARARDALGQSTEAETDRQEAQQLSTGPDLTEAVEASRVR